MISIHNLKDPSGPILFDGGFGAALQYRGLTSGTPPETWNIARPEEVRKLHAEFVAAGSAIIESNTFGANSCRWHASGERAPLGLVIHEACRLAASAADAKAVVAASTGPLGDVLEPYGELSRKQGKHAFREQYTMLKSEGIRVLLIETMMSLDEALLALETAKEVGFDAVGVTMTFEPGPHGPRTAFGVAPAEAARRLSEAGANIVGSNCGSGFDTMRIVAAEFLEYAGVPVLIQPNAGIPVVGADGPMYPETPESFGEFLQELYETGVRLLGGCCGSGPEHIACAKAALRRHSVGGHRINI
ncbi:MAG: hypothetical protein A3C56_05950 [Ignavibacteria bacterium RIFCSPHIGHO2_02_FULL_56_12]|nr:MAG: hypothetical protein A3C56_05950 [Ignavibacteria bacterium RIFCSPHIGHO2_02_FULL_56_12]